MTFSRLLEGIVYTGTVPEGKATLVTQDSRKVKPGTVFVCVKGRISDGHAYAKAALSAGAGLVVTQRPMGLPREVQVEDTRAVYAALCAAFFDHPADKLCLVGVTGTNGKTTVSTVLKQVLSACGLRCGLIGTNKSEIDDMEIPAKFTTPEAWDLNALLARMLAANCTHVVMEASSQALEQGRLHGLRFRLGVFTNLTRDHLDYHGDMERYYQAKKLLFAQCDTTLLNRDDSFGTRLLGELPDSRKYSFSAQGDPSDFRTAHTRLRPDGVRFDFEGPGFRLPASFPMPGGYSVANALAAAGGAVLLGCAPDKVAEALGGTQGVAGRCEVLYSGDFTVISDFAHTADAVESLLSTLRPFVEGRMVVLYGCAGDRDPDKRPRMSESAVRYGDAIYLTSDNPRTEPVDRIFADALPPLEEAGKPYVVEADREAAVRGALSTLDTGDMLVLCGKGHEDYQVMDGYTLYLSERDIVHSWMRENRQAERRSI